jgi:hypothetical protein
LNGVNNYPTTLAIAYNIMQQREDAKGPDGHENNSDTIAFVTAGRDGRTFKIGQYHKCGDKGHYADQCPKEVKDGGDNEGTVFTCTNPGRNIPARWVLLDSEANVDLFCNQTMLKNIRRVNTSMTVHCNAGSRVTNMIGDLPGYPNPVWYSPHAI